MDSFHEYGWWIFNGVTGYDDSLTGLGNVTANTRYLIHYNLLSIRHYLSE